MNKEIEIPEGYEARIEGNKVVFELKESNDDRIMKDIITTLSIGVACDESALHPGACTTLKEAIAYLEKQKGPNFDAVSSWLKDHANNYVNGEFNEFHHCVEYDGTIDVERLIADLKVAVNGAFDVDATFDSREPRDNWEYIKEFCDKFGRIPKDMDELDALVSYVMDKKQKEQKPAERSDSVAKEMFIKALERAVEQTKKGYELTDCDKHSWWEDFKAYSEIKSAEWSEEDEWKRNELLKYLEEKGDYRSTWYSWLKSLPGRFNPQPKQEWSQDDNDFADDTIACVTRCYEKYMDNKEFYQSLRHNTMDIKRWLIKVRKRLTPHWKPSEEQIDALKYALGNGGKYDKEALESLLNDLEKL